MREEETASAPQHHARQRLGIDAEPESSSFARASWASATALAHEGLRRKLVIGKCVGKIRMVRASHALGLVHASTVGLPKAVEINPHARNLSFLSQKRKVSALTFLFQERFPLSVAPRLPSADSSRRRARVLVRESPGPFRRKEIAFRQMPVEGRNGRQA